MNPAEITHEHALLEHACGLWQARTEDGGAARDEALLAHARGWLLDTETPGATEMDLGWARAEQAGDRIGHYTLLEPLGEGGFGIVWMAEQHEPVQRRVALKIIKLGMDTREVIARFEQERQALALMDHPHIAAVFDAGATRWGRPFFVMEWVRGVRITEYCDAENLSIPQRLELFVKVCQAVQHAHQKGIIHRDLKPSNILVAQHDGAPMPKVIDFGVAKATQSRLTAETLCTQADHLLGTPLYMSPEQAGASSTDVDTRSDIYSLGVLLYELLTGRTPFDPETLSRQGHDEIRRVIREVDPPRPSERAGRAFSADLDWIVMKCLEKDRTRRYETANGLALDLQRHLRNEPVRARPASFAYRAGKFVRRHRRAVVAAAAVLVALLAGLAASTILYLRERVAWASEAAQRAEAVREAEKSAQIATFLQQMLASMDPKYAQGRDTALLKEMLDRAAQRVGPTFKDQPEVERQLRDTIAAIYRALRLPDAALPQHHRVLELATQLHGPEHPATFEAMEALAKTHFDGGRHEVAVALREQVVALRRKVQSAEHPDTLLAIDKLATSYAHGVRADEALELREQVLALTRKVQGSKHPRTFRAVNRLSDSYSSAGRHDEALALREKAQALRDRK